MLWERVRAWVRCAARRWDRTTITGIRSVMASGPLPAEQSTEESGLTEPFAFSRMNGRYSIGVVPKFGAEPTSATSSFSTELIPQQVTAADEIEGLLRRIVADNDKEGSVLPAQIERLRSLIAEREAEHAKSLRLAQNASLRQTLLAGLGPVATVLAFFVLTASTKHFYFEWAGDCDTFEIESKGIIEELVGAAPVWGRNMLILTALQYCCRKAAVPDSGSHASLPVALLVGTQATLGSERAAGWLAIVGDELHSASQPQSTWAEARSARRMNSRQAVLTSIAKLVLWHWTQPLAYLWVLGIYRCTIDEEWYQYLAALVAARELVYLATTVLAIWFCPVFLLLDPVTSWREAEPGLRALRVACYVLTPHNYVALCLANKFRSYRVGFLMLASVQVLADFSSCFTLVLALVNQHHVTALVIGYSITATSFIFFFAPMSIMSNLAAAIYQDGQSRLMRVWSALKALLVLFVVAYTVVCIGLLAAGVDPVCNGFTMTAPDCGHHGHCAANGLRCDCDWGYGPDGEVGFAHLLEAAKPMCTARNSEGCPASQIVRGAQSAECSNACCGGRGQCSAHGVCIDCSIGFTGSRCEVVTNYTCAAVNQPCCGDAVDCGPMHSFCAAQGVLPSPCVCADGSYGAQCATGYTLSGNLQINGPGFLGTYVRGQQICDGAPVFQLPDAYYGKTAYLYRSSALGVDWSIAESDDPVDCKRDMVDFDSGLDGMVPSRGSGAGRCRKLPNGTGCVGRWRECDNGLRMVENPSLKLTPAKGGNLL